MDLETFVSKDIIVHDVPRGGNRTEEPRLTDEPIQLDRELRDYFERKIVTSLGSRGLEVVADPAKSPAVRQAVAAIVSDSLALVPESKSLARCLHTAQTGRNPAGLVTVMTGRVNESACLAILKLEREQGLRFQITQSDGRSVVDLELLRNLTLTDKTKVFKTALFTVDDLSIR